MIPALLASAAHQILSHSARSQPSTGTNAAPFSVGDGSKTKETRGPSIASDVGQLTTDALTLLGLGGGSPAQGNANQAAKAYAAPGRN